MTLDPPSGPGSTPDLTATLNQLWIRFLPEIRERVAILEAAAQARVAGVLTSEQREAAHSAAHKLAGTLGTFNLPRGTDFAREFEHACASEESCAATEAQRLSGLAAEIRSVIDGRN
jgi:HPt (histidine-containing phosphotransfer) domain-containing protein